MAAVERLGEDLSTRLDTLITHLSAFQADPPDPAGGGAPADLVL